MGRSGFKSPVSHEAGPVTFSLTNLPGRLNWHGDTYACHPELHEGLVWYKHKIQPNKDTIVISDPKPKLLHKRRLEPFPQRTSFLLTDIAHCDHLFKDFVPFPIFNCLHYDVVGGTSSKTSKCSTWRCARNSELQFEKIYKHVEFCFLEEWDTGSEIAVYQVGSREQGSGVQSNEDMASLYPNRDETSLPYSSTFPPSFTNAMMWLPRSTMATTLSQNYHYILEINKTKLPLQALPRHQQVDKR